MELLQNARLTPTPTPTRFTAGSSDHPQAIGPRLKWNIPTRDMWKLHTRNNKRGFFNLPKSSAEVLNQLSDHIIIWAEQPLNLVCHCTNKEDKEDKGGQTREDAFNGCPVTDEDCYSEYNEWLAGDTAFITKKDTDWLISLLEAIRKSPSLFLESLKESLSTIPQSQWKGVASPLLVLLIGQVLKSKIQEPEQVSLDVVGLKEDAKGQLRMLCSRLKNKIPVKNDGMQKPVGVLIYGPEGVGKTTLANALAREAGITFLPISGLDIRMANKEARISMIRSLFIEARACSPSIMHIENVEVIAMDQAINKSDPKPEPNYLLLELIDQIMKSSMDGRTVAVIATTDKLELLDPRLVASTAFLTKVKLDRPDEKERRKIMELYMGKNLKQEDKEAIYSFVVSKTGGFVTTNLDKLAMISIVAAKNKGEHYVSMEDVVEAFERMNELKSIDKEEGNGESTIK